ncbi:hypothetical protein HYALB_00006072 [Hymenoscyphus albidus]|uniref:Uncharacterized protein n=1 Tax=Hymenoscyphus albidus TaxID=595503 RepID=A0A9N9LXS1_9HELO|nr:hypothetical protein HYALB_00006072 [Hymenoscyphus albidus]
MNEEMKRNKMVRSRSGSSKVRVPTTSKKRIRLTIIKGPSQAPLEEEDEPLLSATERLKT